MNVLRYVGKKQCRNKRYSRLLTKSVSDVIVLDLVSNRPNITLRAELDGKPLQLKASANVRDFRDIAVMSYILDAVSRRKDGSDYWSRDFECVYPVRDAALWSHNDAALKHLLAILAGDRYQYDWLAVGKMPPHPKHHAQISKEFDAICLFSGGVDSLLGAYELLEQGMRILLVGHQSEPCTAKAQKEVLRHLLTIFPGRASLVQFRVAVSQKERPRFPIAETREDTHRVRSFLFLGLAVAVAEMAEIQRIYMPENGLIAVNPPLDFSRLGTCSTRTAHPRFLRAFIDLSRTMGIFDGQLKNPFLYQSKTDMVLTAPPKLREALLRSVSCARPSRNQDKHVRHCGYCVPCIYRRTAFAAAGLDDSSDYAFDVFEQLDTLKQEKRLDFECLFDFSQRYGSLTDLRKQAVVLSQGYFSPEFGGEVGPHATSDYSPWIGMLDRWCRDFLLLVEKISSVATKNLLSRRVNR